MKLLRTVLCLCVLGLSCVGCALHYFDTATGTEHLWGIGHVKMRVALPEEGLQAIVRGTDVLGFSLGRADRQFYLTLGWNRVQYLDIVQANTALRLEWPDADFANVRVGSRFPFTTTEVGARAIPPACGGEEGRR